jgi:hypothetical protein
MLTQRSACGLEVHRPNPGWDMYFLSVTTQSTDGLWSSLGFLSNAYCSLFFFLRTKWPKPSWAPHIHLVPESPWLFPNKNVVSNCGFSHCATGYTHLYVWCFIRRILCQVHKLGVTKSLMNCTPSNTAKVTNSSTVRSSRHVTHVTETRSLCKSVVQKLDGI